MDDIVIVGAGIGGLTLGLTLHAVGIPCRIFESAPEIRAVGVPIIALNMVGSITDHVDLVVSDPVQAGTMAVMAIADTASFDLVRQKGRRY